MRTIQKKYFIFIEYGYKAISISLINVQSVINVLETKN